MTDCCPSPPPPRCAHLSPARRLAHAELARLSLERFVRETREAASGDGATWSIRFSETHRRQFEHAVRVSNERELAKHDEAFRREIARMEDGWDEP